MPDLTREDALLIKSELKLMTPEQQANWYRGQKLNRHLEDKRQRRTFQRPKAVVNTTKKTANYTDVLYPHEVFEDWAARKMTLKIYHTLADADAGWKEALRAPRASVIKLPNGTATHWPFLVLSAALCSI